jgi:hypothetical protein
VTLKLCIAVKLRITIYAEDLKTWGYDVAEYDDYYDFDVSLPIKVALDGLGISMKKHTEGGQMYAFMWEHEIETEHDKKKYPVSLILLPDVALPLTTTRFHDLLAVKVASDTNVR